MFPDLSSEESSPAKDLPTLVTEVSHVIRALVQSTPSVQRATIERYFTADASFTHPFCRTGSFNGSRWLIWCIYRWYKIMSPKIEIDIDSIGKLFLHPSEK
jgi:hypothetical protein